MKVLTHKDAARMATSGEAQGDFSYWTADKRGFGHRNTWFLFPVDAPRSHLRVLGDGSSTETCPVPIESDDVPACAHSWTEVYYGYQCSKCGLFYPFGSAPWEMTDAEVISELQTSGVDLAELDKKMLERLIEAKRSGFDTPLLNEAIRQFDSQPRYGTNPNHPHTWD